MDVLGWSFSVWQGNYTQFHYASQTWKETNHAGRAGAPQSDSKAQKQETHFNNSLNLVSRDLRPARYLHRLLWLPRFREANWSSDPDFCNCCNLLFRQSPMSRFLFLIRWTKKLDLNLLLARHQTLVKHRTPPSHLETGMIFRLMQRGDLFKTAVLAQVHQAGQNSSPGAFFFPWRSKSLSPDLPPTG